MNPNTEVGLVGSVIGIIVLLILWAIKQWCSAFYRLKQEELSVLAQMKNAPPQSFDVAKKQLNSKEIKASRVARTLLAFLEQGRAGTEDLTFEDWIFWPRYWAGVFVFMGLLGTVLGMLAAVYYLGNTLKSSESADLEQLSLLQVGIAALLQNMKFAFLSTFTGLCGTLLLSWLNSTFLARSGHLATDTFGFATEYLLPLHLAHQKQELAAEHLQLRDERQQSAEQMIGVVTRLNQTVVTLEGATGQLASQLAPAAQHFVEVSRHTAQIGGQLSQAADRIQSEAERTSRIYTAMEVFLRNTYSTLLAQHAKFEENMSALSETLSSFQISSARLSADISVERQEVVGVAASVIKAMDAARHTAAQLQKELAQMHEAQAQEIAALVDRVITTHENSVERIEEGVRSLQERGETHLTLLTERVAASYRAAVPRFQEALGESQRAQQERMEQLATGFATRSERSMETFATDVSRARQTQENNLQEVVSRIAKSFGDTLYELREEHSASQETQRAFVEDFVERVSRTQGELRALLHLFERTLLDMTALSEAPSLHGQIGDIKTNLQLDIAQVNRDLIARDQIHTTAVDTLLNQLHEVEDRLRREYEREITNLRAEAVNLSPTASTPVSSTPVPSDADLDASGSRYNYRLSPIKHQEDS